MSMDMFGQAPETVRGREFSVSSSGWDQLYGYWRIVAPDVLLSPGDNVTANEVLNQPDALLLARRVRDGVSSGLADAYGRAWDAKDDQSRGPWPPYPFSEMMASLATPEPVTTDNDFFADFAKEQEGWFSRCVEDFAAFLEVSGGVDVV